jgi:hypothetical protein
MTANPIFYDVATLLSDNGLGTLGDSIFGGEWNIGQDKQVLCLEGIGTPSDVKDSFEQPSVQILVRGDRNQASHLVYDTAKKIYDFLILLSETVTVNNTEYKGFEPSSNIAALGKDDNERHTYSMNFYSYRSAT